MRAFRLTVTGSTSILASVAAFPRAPVMISIYSGAGSFGYAKSRLT